MAIQLSKKPDTPGSRRKEFIIVICLVATLVGLLVSNGSISPAMVSPPAIDSLPSFSANDTTHATKENEKRRSAPALTVPSANSSVGVASLWESMKTEVVPPQPTEPSENRVKFFAMHIGPSKTGTSSIQEDLIENPFHHNTLGPDRVIYVGKKTYVDGDGKEQYHLPARDVEVRNIDGRSITSYEETRAFQIARTCMIEKLDAYLEGLPPEKRLLDIDQESKASLREEFLEDCWKKNPRGDYLYMTDYSLIDSDEGYSYRSSNVPGIGKKFQIFDILGYDRLIAVAAYRRWAQWIVSAYHQSIKANFIFPSLKTDGHVSMRLARGIKVFLWSQLNKNKGDMKYGTNMYANLDTTVPHLEDAYPSSKVEVKILNYFQQPKTGHDESPTGATKIYDSITTELYCEALGMELVPHTCSHALSNARRLSVSSSTPPKVSNKGSVSNMIYHDIIAGAYQRGLLLPTEDQHADRMKIKQACEEGRYCGKKSCKDSWCEVYHTCVGGDYCETEESQRNQQGWYSQLDESDKRNNITVTGTSSSTIPRSLRDLSDYHVNVQNATWTRNLPLLCYNDEFLSRLLQKSLDFEELVMPDYYKTPLGKAEHERLFWDVWHGEKRMFCWIDLFRLFENTTSWEDVIDDRMVREWPIVQP